MSDLKPCPFCGKDVFLLDVATRSSANAKWDVYCRTHGCFLNSGTNNMFSNREDAILAWNTRAESLELTALRERVKVLREALDGLLFLFAAKGESSLDTFERIGDAFYRDTLMLRPGKSEPFECDYEGRNEERRAAFDAWIEKRKESAAIVLNQTKPKEDE